MAKMMPAEELRQLALDALEERKGVDIRVFDVRGFTSVTDWMLVASGNSDRHVKSLADNLVERAKAAGIKPLGVEGEQDAEWLLIDLGDVVVHVMRPQVRAFYNLENLWEVADERAVAAGSERHPLE